MKKTIKVKELIKMWCNNETLPQKIIYGEDTYLLYNYGSLKDLYKLADNNYFLPINNIFYLDQYITIVEDILNGKEEEYLSSVIKPFRDKVMNITLNENFGRYFISICVYNEKYENIENINLPYFEPNSMYKNMVLDKEYTLEELCL